MQRRSGAYYGPVVVSRPDAAYAVGVLSQFIQNPGQAHWDALKTFGLPLEDALRPSLRGIVMQIGLARNTGTPSRDTHSIW